MPLLRFLAPNVTTEPGAQPSIVFSLFAAVKGLSAITGPLIAAALHPKKLAQQELLRSGQGGWGGFGFNGVPHLLESSQSLSQRVSFERLVP
jgi:hypothetical protein